MCELMEEKRESAPSIKLKTPNTKNSNLHEKKLIKILRETSIWLLNDGNKRFSCSKHLDGNYKNVFFEKLILTYKKPS